MSSVENKVGAMALLAAASCLGCNAVIGLEPGGTLCDATWAHWPSGAARSYETTEETALDRVTGLRWTRHANPAQGFTAAAATCEKARFDGVADFRLPTRIELLSLLDLTKSPAIDSVVFPLPQGADGYWTTSAPVNKPLDVAGTKVLLYNLAVNPITGQVTAADPKDAGKQLFSLCVHPDAVKPVGVTAAECSDRYAPSEDGAVLVDRETGLAWQKGENDAPAATRGEAEALCKGLTIAGGGFRLPTLGELDTLIDEASSGDVEIDGRFNATAVYYWSSTANPAKPGETWVVSFYNAEVFSFPDGGAQERLVRCVR